MNHYIDMHCHIIPGVDDGAADLAEAKQMLEIAYADGIRCIIATPHFHPRRGKASAAAIREHLELLRCEAKKLDENFRIYLGREIYFGQDIPQLLKRKKVQSINGSGHVLVEFSVSESWDYMLRGIQQLQMRGFRVILAHIERYACILENVDYARHLYNIGVLIQINADSIVGRTNRNVKRFVHTLLEEEMVFCVGTDAHDVKKRAPRMSKAAQYVEKKYGEEYARRIFLGNAKQMLRKRR